MSILKVFQDITITPIIDTIATTTIIFDTISLFDARCSEVEDCSIRGISVNANDGSRRVYLDKVAGWIAV